MYPNKKTYFVFSKFIKMLKNYKPFYNNNNPLKIILKYIKWVNCMLPNSLKFFNINLNNLEIITSPGRLKLLADFLTKNSNSMFNVLFDIIAYDKPEQIKSRFYVKYGFLSTVYNSRIFITVQTDELQKIGLPSLSKIVPSSIWLEREVWDMFGIFFINHPDLRRILTDYGFSGHPLRKGFPVTGYSECAFSSEFGRVCYYSAEFSQEFRNLKFN